MLYSEEFKRKVKEIFPNNVELHKGLEKQSVSVLYYLKRSSEPKPISYDDILAVKSFEEFQELQARAREGKAKEELFPEVNELFNKFESML